VWAGRCWHRCQPGGHNRHRNFFGAGEILLTSKDRDGTKDGYDIPVTKAIAEAVDIPVIASGGVGTMDHIYDAFVNGAGACLAASIFHYETRVMLQIRDSQVSFQNVESLTDP